MSEGDNSGHKKLDHAFVGGLAWSAGAKWLTQAITWASVFIAARLLSPSDFGLAEMAGFLMGVTNVLAEFGISTAVMQMHELDRRVIAQLNTVSVAMCTLVFAGASASAPLIAMFFRNGKLVPMVIVSSLVLFFVGFQAIPNGLLQKDLDYRRISIAEAVLVLVQAVATVFCAWRGMGPWSLVFSVLAGKGVSAALTMYWRPSRFALPRWHDVSAPLGMAWHVTVGRVAWVLYSQADGIIVGRTMGEAALGSYRLAINLASAPAEKIAMLIMRVVGPLFAKVQTDHALVRRYFLIVTETLALSVFPLTFGLAAVAPEFVRVVLGPRWVGAVAPVRWLAVFMGLRTMNSLIGQVLTSLRFTGFAMWMSLLSFVIMPVAFWVASHWGTAAVAATWLILSPVTIGPLVGKLLSAIRLRYRDYLDSLLPSLVGSAAMLIVVMVIRTWFMPEHWPAVVNLAVQITAGGVVYGGLMLTVYRERVLRYVHFVQRLRKDRAAAVVEEF